METGTDMQTACANLFVKVTPEQLRNIANKIENLSSRTLPGQTVSYNFSPGITLLFEPKVSLEKFARNLIKEIREEKELPYTLPPVNSLDEINP